MDITLTIDDAAKHTEIQDAIADHLGEDYWRIDIRMPEHPVYVDGESTPLQSANTSYEDVVQWLHGEGGAPSTIYDGNWQTGVVDDDLRIEWEDIDLEIEMPDELPGHDYDMDDLHRLIEWASDGNVEVDSDTLRAQAQAVLDALD